MLPLGNAWKFAEDIQPAELVLQREANSWKNGGSQAPFGAHAGAVGGWGAKMEDVGKEARGHRKQRVHETGAASHRAARAWAGPGLKQQEMA